MSAVRVQCPGCGAAVVFATGTGAVAVCPYCRTAVARGDRDIEDLGKVAAVVDTGSVLKVGLEGRYEGVKFRLTGRTQMKHALGGVWDEWHAELAGGRWGWLAEAQGRFYMTFEQSLPPDLAVPDFNSLQIDQQLPLSSAASPFVVAEKGIAAIAAAEGELPWRPDLGGQYPYADLSAEGGGFATLDYSGDGPPTLYVGRQVTLDELNVPKTARKETWELRAVPGKKLDCPKCGGSLDIRVPDKTERVGCPYCGSLLEATEGKLRFLTKPAKLARELEIQIPLGTVGHIGDAERTVIGFFRRSVTFDRVDYFWDEYLLYHPRDGFEWLTQSDGHWNHVVNVPAGDVSGWASAARYRGQQFRIFQSADATMRAVVGECYWKVSVGETVRAMDYVAPPLMLTREATGRDGAEQEVNWSLGRYIAPAEVKKAFNLSADLPAPTGVGPNQPFLNKRVYALAAIFLPIFCVIAIFFAARSRTVFEETYQIEPPGPGEKDRVFFSKKFELKSHANICVTASCPNLDNTWVSIEGDLVSDADGKLQPFVLGVGYYHGVDEGEAWSEGSRADEAFVSSQAAGTYSLRLEVDPENKTFRGPLTVKVQQGVARLRTAILALLALLAFPIGVGIYHLLFEMKRWKDSAFSPYQNVGGSSNDSDDDGDDD